MKQSFSFFNNLESYLSATVVKLVGDLVEGTKVLIGIGTFVGAAVIGALGIELAWPLDVHYWHWSVGTRSSESATTWTIYGECWDGDFVRSCSEWGLNKGDGLHVNCDCRDESFCRICGEWISGNHVM